MLNCERKLLNFGKNECFVYKPALTSHSQDASAVSTIPQFLHNENHQKVIVCPLGVLLTTYLGYWTVKVWPQKRPETKDRQTKSDFQSFSLSEYNILERK